MSRITLGMAAMPTAYGVTSAELANTGASLGPLPWIAGVLLLGGIILAVVKITAARRK